VGAKTALEVVLDIVLIALAGAGIYAIVVLVGTLRSARKVLDDVGTRLPSLIDNADITAQAMSLELMRLDDILMNVQGVSDTVGSATKAAEEAVQVPIQKAGEYAERVRRFLARWRERKEE
jgi:uncharacterized protein YoxC